MNAQSNLLEVVAAAHPTRRFPRRLNGRQQQADHHPNDRNDYEKLHQCKASDRTFSHDQHLCKYEN